MTVINRPSYWFIREQSVCLFTENIPDVYSSVPRKWITVTDFINVGRFDQQDYSRLSEVLSACTVQYKEAFQLIR